ncbi:MAG: hypothetical protein KBE25_01060 [Laribacter sp.]|nr:hypothetical protein [Laribacter sp.]MBP9528361.1 hypothetical protein [Laribacter sp.]MBP9607932.1 hypothetical protein [Laribacter sp.]
MKRTAASRSSKMPKPTCMAESAASRVHGPLLLLGVAIMLGLTAYPALLAMPDGKADHPAALLLFWAMSASFVRGVGFVPHNRLIRLLLGGPAALLALLAAAVRLWS